ncbi:MAG: AIR synthase-related protein [Actinomycetota bacterium]
MDAYREAGVDYDVLDAAKRQALAAAAATHSNPGARGGVPIAAALGEPAFVFRIGNEVLAFVLECLGTKSLLAREYEDVTGNDRWAGVAYDTVAAIANDLCCVGALPLVVNAYFATGDAGFYTGNRRLDSLVAGWKRACDDAGAAWGGGESPTLAGLVSSSDIELAGSSVGRIPDGVEPILGDGLESGDAIVLVSSTGLHANGASLARRVAAELPEGLRTKLPSGRDFGDALLDPAPIYVGLVEELLNRRIEVTYISHITGHGLRKLMRARRELSYEIEALPDVPEVLSYLVDSTGLDAAAAYGTFNMGAGLAVFCRDDGAEMVVQAAAASGLSALVAGRVEAGPRGVHLKPIDVTYSGEQLELR